MIGIDTFSWGKLIFLKNKGWDQLIMEIIKKGSFFTTFEVKFEFEHRFPDYLFLLDYVTLYPKIDIDFGYYLSLGFDPADASLLEYNKKENNIIITEDHLMLDESISSGKNVIQLADYFGALFEEGFIKNREFYHLIRFLKKYKNITNKKEKELLDLRKIS